MAETNITADKVNGQVIQADHVNELKSALVTTLSGRDSTGTMSAGQQLGSATYPWGLAYIDSLISNGSLIDFSSLTTESNKIISGQTRSTSDQADFIRALGTSPAADIQGGTTALSLVINGSAATVDTTINLTSLTTAASGVDSQCNINEIDWSGQEFTKYAGEQDIINIDLVGLNITAKVGQVVCLRAGTEYLLAYVKSPTELSNCKRGYFFNSSGLPVVRTVLNNNDTLDLMSLGYVFIEDDGATVEVSYLNPVYSFNEPIGAATGQYWFDLQSSQWRRYDGANFIVINRILTGLVVIDPTNCVASRSLDFDLDYSDLNSIIFNEFDDTIITSKRVDNSISVNANKFDIKNKISFNITTDRVSGVSETADTTYYCYLTQEGQKFIDTERPYQLDPFKKGNYHPYNSWRCLLSFYNDSSSNISSITNIENKILSNVTINNKLNTQPNAATISGGAVTYTGAYMVIDTEGGAASDDLDTISGGSDGDIIIISSANDSRDVTIKHLTGNINLSPKNDVTLLNIADKIVLQYSGVGSAWFEVSRAVDKDFLNSKTTSGYTYLPNGLIMQWGSNVITGSANLDVNLPITYPNTHLRAYASQGTTTFTSLTDGVVGADELSTSQIRLMHNYDGGNPFVTWYSIGY